MGKVRFNPDSKIVTDPKSDLLVITIATGSFQEMLKISGPIFREYAKKCGADYLEVTDTTQLYGVFEKWRLASLEGYKRYLYIDADVVLKNCPNMFQQFAPGKVHIHNDWDLLPNRGWMRSEWQYCEISKDEFDDSIGLNTGVVLFDDEHKHIWTAPDVELKPSHCIEQSWVQHQIQTKNIPYQSLPTSYNTQWWMKEFVELRKVAHVVHFSSAPDRVNKMRQEVEWCPFQEGWKCTLASTFVGKEIISSPDTCTACELCSKPRTLNPVTAKLAASVCDDPELLKTLQTVVDGGELPSGVGTNLAKVFSWAFIKARPGCKCKGWEDILNGWGPAKCEQEQDKIIDQLQKEAKRRKLPFVRSVARMLLLGVIKTSK
jgi:hypothetical protein